MKIPRMLAAAGLVIASLGVSTVADAQNYRDHDRGYNDHRGDRGDRGGRWNNRGRHNGWDRHRNRCRVEWRHHRQVRICR